MLFYNAIIIVILMVMIWYDQNSDHNDPMIKWYDSGIKMVT